MKWVFYVIVFVYMAYRAVYGAKVGTEISIEKIDYGNDTFLNEGTRKAINCRASSKNQRLEWFSPSGKLITRMPSSRVFAQGHFTANPFGMQAPALALVFSELTVKDTGVYQCRSGKTVQEVSLCVIKPSEFVNTPTEVTAALGRAITLTCSSRGDPEAKLEWRRNSFEISEYNDSSKYQENKKYNLEGYETLLTITSLEPEDSGVYTCVSIQKTDLDDCSNSETLNITLQVSHGPLFANGNETKAVYGKANDIVDLVCSAKGYPAPTYRWYKVVNADTLAKFDENQIKYSENQNQAVLSVTASATTFGYTYKCLATNVYGVAEKYFVLNAITKPEKPSEVDVNNITNERVELNVTWPDVINFPVEGFQVQYLKGKRKPKDSEWRKASLVFSEIDDDFYTQFPVFPVTIEGLEESMSYWIRVRATNSAGDGPWSEPIFYTHIIEIVESEEDTDIEESEEPVAAEVSSDATFYGIFFAGGIAVVAVVCMFAMRLV